jgi:hypothetical protein
MRFGQVVSYGLILCFAGVVGSARAQSDPPEFRVGRSKYIGSP